MNKKRMLLLIITIFFLICIGPTQINAYTDSNDFYVSEKLTLNLEWQCHTGVTGGFTANDSIDAWIQRTPEGIGITLEILWNTTGVSGSWDIDFESDWKYELVFENTGSNIIHVDYTVNCKAAVPGFELIFLIIGLLSLIGAISQKNLIKK